MEFIFQALACEIEYVIEADREGIWNWNRVQYAMDHLEFTPYGYAFEKTQKVKRWVRLGVSDTLANDCKRNSYDYPNVI